jgi:hypothetical protein
MAGMLLLFEAKVAGPEGARKGPFWSLHFRRQSSPD